MERIFKITPFLAVNDIKLGNERPQIRNILGNPSSEMMIGYPVQDHYSDDYGYMQLTYNPDLRLVSVTLTPFLTRDILFVEFGEERVNISTAKDEVIPEFISMFEDLTEDEDEEGFTSRKYGVRVYCPEDDIEDVIIHTEGLYE